ncbi:MAG: TATA-box-binding protein [archaeon]
MAKKTTKKSTTKPVKKQVIKKSKTTKPVKRQFIKKPKVKIENVVASASVDAEIDLDKIAATLPNAEYEPEQFPGLVLRLTDPKAAILVFSSGKMVCTGAKEVAMIKVAIDKTIKQIKTTGTKVRGEATITVQNIVASSDLGVELNLDKIAFSLQNAEFEPEQFPGLVFRVFDPKVVFLLFRSGKIVCTGAKKKIDVERGVAKLIQELKKIKAL